MIIRGIEKKPIVDDDKDKKEFVLRMGTLSKEEKTPIMAAEGMPQAKIECGYVVFPTQFVEL